MNSIRLERTTLRPCEILRGKVSWSIEHMPKDLEVRLFWYHGDSAYGEARTLDRCQLGEAREGKADFEFDLPELPWSIHGQMVRIDWAVELVEKKAGSLALAEFVMSPDGKVVTLGKVDKPITEKGLRWG